MQFTKEAIALAKDSIEAIKFLVKKVGKECPKCGGRGRIKVPEITLGTRHVNTVRCSNCNGTGEISQQEMIRQAQESIAKKESGKYQLVYKKDRKTIIAEPRGWEWEPNPKDTCFDKAGNELIVIGINRRKPWLIEVARVYEDDIDLDSKTVCPDEVIPLLHWEDDIEPILKRMKYRLEITHSVGGKQACSIYLLNQHEVTAWGKDRQTSVVLALIELRKKVEK